MKVACHFTVPQPVDLRIDAAVQDGLCIVEKNGGEINFLYPGRDVKIYFPRFLSGLQQLRKLREIEKRIDIHHVFSNGFYPYPIYSLLKKPIVVSTVIGLSGNAVIRYPLLFRKVKHFIVPSEQDQQLMKLSGYKRVSVVRPGIDLTRFSYTPCSDTAKIMLLVGSAPWNEDQFDKKGVNLLLEVMSELPWLHITFLWRGVLRELLEKKVAAARLSDRVKILEGYVDVNEVLAGVHATVVLASDEKVIKAYPHSIMESLAAKKPVIVSGCLQIKKYVKEKKCGVIVNSLDKKSLHEALWDIKNNYQNYCDRLQSISEWIFSDETMLKKINVIYNGIL